MPSRIGNESAVNCLMVPCSPSNVDSPATRDETWRDRLDKSISLFERRPLACGGCSRRVPCAAPPASTYRSIAAGIAEDPPGRIARNDTALDARRPAGRPPRPPGNWQNICDVAVRREISARHLRRHPVPPYCNSLGEASMTSWRTDRTVNRHVRMRRQGHTPEANTLAERSGTLADDPFQGRRPTSHERMTGLPGRVVSRRTGPLGYRPAAAGNSASGSRRRIHRSGARCGLRDRRERSPRRRTGIVGSGR